MWLREQLDKILLSDHEWKKKYCPHLYEFLSRGGKYEFSLGDEMGASTFIGEGKEKEEVKPSGSNNKREG